MKIESLNKLADKWLVMMIFAVTTVFAFLRPDVPLFADAWKIVLGALLAMFQQTVEIQASHYTIKETKE